MVSFDLKDRIALVTGASRGIGRAIAETLAEQGAETILVSRNPGFRCGFIHHRCLHGL